jgi:hypothetical protein
MLMLGIGYRLKLDGIITPKLASVAFGWRLMGVRRTEIMQHGVGIGFGIGINHLWGKGLCLLWYKSFLY